MIRIITLLVLWLGFGANTVFAQNSATNQSLIIHNEDNLNAVLGSISNKLNETLPMMVDAQTQLDASMGFQRMFLYRYTLVNLALENVDVTEFKSQMEPRIVNTICTTEKMQFFVVNDITMIYSYYGKAGKQIAEIEVPASRCADF